MWQVYGQDHLLRQLEQSLKQDHMAHAYLLVGPPHVGKMTLALNLAQSVNCLQGPSAPCSSCVQCTRIARGHHADVRVIGVRRDERGGPTRTVIGIDDVKMALHQVGLKPYEGACGVIIFDGAESMSEEAANALLKTLEEPPPQTILLLLTANEDALLPTIRSRCHRLLLRPTPKQQIMDKLVSEYSADPHQVEQLSRLSRGCFGWAINALTISELLERRKAELEQVRETTEASLESRLEYASELASLFSRDREAARQVLYLWQSWWRDLLLVKEGAVDYIHNTDWVAQLSLQAARLTVPQMTGFLKRVLQTLEALDRNANARLALEVMMLDLPVHPQNSP